MRYLTLGEVVELHDALIESSGGARGLRDLAALEAAIAQPRATFEGHDLYPGLIEKAAALGFGLVLGHPFVDGNKRVGHAGMEAFLILNGAELDARVEEQERAMLALAAGETTRESFTEWVRRWARSSR